MTNRPHTFRQRLRYEALEERLNLSTVPLTALPLLSSNPAASQKIFLDFDGHVTSGTLWNNSFSGNDIHSAAYSLDQDITTFSIEELDSIENAWRITSEYFAPFDVDVTTIEPPLTAFTEGSKAIRVLFSDKVDLQTGQDWRTDNINGVAYYNSWDWQSDTPAWVFYASDTSAYTAVHEIGHTFGIVHDGQIGQTTYGNGAYYDGHTVDGSDYYWQTVMGIGYPIYPFVASQREHVIQWSKGEYTNATSNQDDISILESHLGLRADDHVSSHSAAQSISPIGGALGFQGEGLIGTQGDLDYFKFEALGGESLFVEAVPSGTANTLKTQIKVYDQYGSEVASSINSPEALHATSSTLLGAGFYYIAVDGIGVNTPDNGFSDYGSLGAYSLSGLLTATPQVIRLDESPEEKGRVQLSFSGDLAGSLDSTDLKVFDPSGQQVDPALITYNSSLRLWELSMDNISSGQYSIVLASQGVHDSSGTELDGDNDGYAGGDYTFTYFHRQPGDANVDGFVDAADISIIIDNFFTYQPNGTNPPAVLSWEAGNFNGDWNIDISDLTIAFGQFPVIDIYSTAFDGDFTQDGVVNGSDVDFLYRGIGAAATTPAITPLILNLYDLNNDGSVDQGDVDELIFAIIGTEYGDTDLDGDVDIIDFGALADSYGSAGDGWASGDFDGDGDVDGDDYGVLSGNYGYGT